MPQAIPWELIQPGYSIPGAILDHTGRVLIESGVELTDADVRALDALREDAVFGDSAWDEELETAHQNSLSEEYHHMVDPPILDDVSNSLIIDDEDNDEDFISVEALHNGMRLAQDIYDQADVLLLAAGMEITQRFLELLRQRQIKVVRLRSTPPEHSPEVEQVTSFEDRKGKAGRRLDEILPQILQQLPKIFPVRPWRRPRITLDTLRKEAIYGLKRHADTSEMIAQIGSSLQVGGQTTIRALRDSMQNFVNMVTLDFDLLPLIISMQHTKDEYLFDHSVNVSMVAMTIAAQLGMTQDQIMEVGLGGLLQDIGMLRIPGQIRLAPRKLTPREKKEIEKHPLYTLEMLEGIRGLPDIIKVIGYQVHERKDGSGYPNQIAGEKLHPYSMIVSIADKFSSMTRPRPYRPAAMPYEAARNILIGGSANKYDIQIVRAFLDAMSLFPIGSIVQLSDGLRAQVVRANPDYHTKPMVEVLDHNDNPTKQFIDLSKESELSIVSAFPPLRIHES